MAQPSASAASGASSSISSNSSSLGQLLNRTHLLVPCIFYGSQTMDAPRSKAEVSRLAKRCLAEEEADAAGAAGAGAAGAGSAAPSRAKEVRLALPRLLGSPLLLLEPHTDSVVFSCAMSAIILCCTPDGNDDMLGMTRMTPRRKKDKDNGAPMPAGICFLFRFDEAHTAQTALRTISAAFDFLKKLIDHQDETSTGVATPSVVHPLTFLFDLSVGMMEQEKTGSTHYGYCPCSKGTFKTRIDRHRRFVLGIEQKSYQPMVFERMRRLGVSALPWQAAAFNADGSQTYTWLDIVSAEYNEQSMVVIAHWPDSKEFSSAFKDTSVTISLALELDVVGVLEPLTIQYPIKLRPVKGNDLLWMQGKRDALEQEYELQMDMTTRRDGLAEYHVAHLLTLAGATQQTYLERLNRVMKAKRSEAARSEENIAEAATKAATAAEPAPPATALDASQNTSVHTDDVSISASSGGGADDGKDKKEKSDADSEAADNAEDQDKDEADDIGSVMGVSGRDHVEIELTEHLLEQWSAVLSKWDSTPRSRIAALARKGVPDRLRKEVWMLLADAQNAELEASYRLLSSQTSASESVIKWDLERTFPAHEKYREKDGPGQRELSRVNTAYSNYDTDVGYCQGLSFITAVLLLHMPEEMAFQVFASMMQKYGLRELYKAGFENLTLRFYQLERLMEDTMPDLLAHMKEQRIEIHMFASQWFLTLFATKFSLTLVFRIFDFFLAEGFNTIFQISLALLKTFKKEIMSKTFEEILGFFRLEMPDACRDERSAYNLIIQASKIKILDKKLAKYEKDYADMKALTEDPLKRLEQENASLQAEKSVLSAEVDALQKQLYEVQSGMQRSIQGNEVAAEALAREKDRLERMYARLQTDAKTDFQQLEEELQHVKELYRSTVSDAENTKAKLQKQLEESATAMKLKDRELAELNERVTKLQAIATASKADEQKIDLAARVHELELELAQAKFQLVERDFEVHGLKQKLLIAAPHADDGSKKKSNLTGLFKR